MEVFEGRLLNNISLVMLVQESCCQTAANSVNNRKILISRMVLQVYEAIKKIGGQDGFVDVSSVQQVLNIDPEIAIEYIRSLQILEYIQTDEKENRVRLTK